MRTLLQCLTAAFLVLLAGQAVEARDGCGRGWYFDGYACRPAYVDSGPRYGYREYGYREYAYPRRGGGVIHGESSFGEPEIWYRPRYDYSGRLRCPPGHTVQDGVCKLYRGY